jgi:hypothetical protein
MFVLVVDACAPSAPAYDLRVHAPQGVAPYVIIGLMEQAKVLLLKPSTEQVDVDDAPDETDSP